LVRLYADERISSISNFSEDEEEIAILRDNYVNNDDIPFPRMM